MINEKVQEHMSEYICKEDLIKRFEQRFCEPCRKSKMDMDGIFCNVCDWNKVIDEIEKCSTADVKPVIHAKWVYDDNHHEYYCSNCEVSKEYISPYCDYCGARMDRK